MLISIIAASSRARNFFMVKSSYKILYILRGLRGAAPRGYR